MGLALCVLHNKVLDLGTFTLDRRGMLLIPEVVHVTTGFLEAIQRHHGAVVRRPQRTEWRLAANSRKSGPSRAGVSSAGRPRRARSVITLGGDSSQSPRVQLARASSALAQTPYSSSPGQTSASCPSGSTPTKKVVSKRIGW